MMINLTTPALLFPAISLLMLAYTNRFLGLASVIRKLRDVHEEKPSDIVLCQIANLRHRMNLLRAMQMSGVASLLGCVTCMFVLFTGLEEAGRAIFAISLLLMSLSLLLSMWEIQISVNALNLHLGDIESRPVKSEEG